MCRTILLLSLLFASLGFSAPITCLENNCIAVVNAGNASSKLRIYQYQLDTSGAPVEIKNVFSKQIEPGFAATALNQKSINHYLSDLFSEVPVQNLPVYFYATSGMRMLNFARQQAYYSKLNQWFAMQPDWHLAVARTLKSKEEALYGWLAVNYELGRLTSPSEPLVSVIDTGSASLQVAFPVRDEQVIDSSDNDYIKINLYGRNISLFTHGFLGLGPNEIRNQYLNHNACFPTHYPLPNGSLGEGDFQACAMHMKPLINSIHEVNRTVKSVLKNTIENHWYIIGGVSAMLQERPFTFDHNGFTSEAFAEKANRQLCQPNWSILGSIYPENRHLFVGCLNASYFYSVFTEGLGISQTQPIRYIPQEISANDWTLGVVFYPGGVQ